MTSHRNTLSGAARRPRDRQMLCEVLMDTGVQFLSADESVASAARRLDKSGWNFMPVCNRLGKVIGVVTARDIAVRMMMMPEAKRDATVSHIMTREFAACGAQDDIGFAEKIMQMNGASRILCLDEAGRLEGIVSLAAISRSAPG